MDFVSHSEQSAATIYVYKDEEAIMRGEEIGLDMAELQVKANHLPIRCETCHQSDCFVPDRNYCSRCADLICSNKLNLLSERKTL
jgi:hypothetical protein